MPAFFSQRARKGQGNYTENSLGQTLQEKQNKKVTSLLPQSVVVELRDQIPTPSPGILLLGQCQRRLIGEPTRILYPG